MIPMPSTTAASVKFPMVVVVAVVTTEVTCIKVALQDTREAAHTRGTSADTTASRTRLQVPNKIVIAYKATGAIKHEN